MTYIPRKFNIPYSIKNIPVTSLYKYNQQLTFRTENLIRRMRWKVYWDKNPDKARDFESYGFATLAKAPACKELRAFEDDLIGMIRDIKTKPYDNPLQRRMKEDLQTLGQMNDQVVVPSDKTGNYFLMDVHEYQQKLELEIRRSYKKVDHGIIEDIDTEAASFANKFHLDDRIEGIALKPSFLTIKDHKEDFPTKVSYRLINPAKSNIGSITKTILQRVNKNIKEVTEVNLWRNTKEAIDWFKNLENKSNLCFLKFDIDSYFPSISKELLQKALDFVLEYDYLTDTERDLIIHCRRSVLVGPNGEIWIKTEGEDFDVSMGSMDSAEISETVGLMILNSISKHFPKKSCGLYRDDGLAAVIGGPQEAERWKKKLISIFKEFGLKISVEVGRKSVDFLDVIFSLETGTYCPYVKPNTTTNYVSIESNHPKTILKTIPKGVAKRLSTNSSSSNEFENHSDHFKEAMKNAGHQSELQYEEESPAKNRRKRKVMYFNPPWSANIATDVGGKFLSLVRKHFGKGTPLYHLFNTKKLKLSYSTVPNMKRLIAGHNKKVIARAEGRESAASYGCNCEDGIGSCPLDGECLTPSLVYKAEIDMGEGTQVYIGQTHKTFKQRFNLHNSDTRTGKKRTTLTTYILDQRGKGNVCRDLRWSKITDAQPRHKGDTVCQLCNLEKTHIATADPTNLLNKRSEILQRCRHRDKLVLTNNLRSSYIRRPNNNTLGVLEEETEERTDNNNHAEQSTSVTGDNDISVLEEQTDILEEQTNRQTEEEEEVFVTGEMDEPTETAVSEETIAFTEGQTDGRTEGGAVIERDRPTEGYQGEESSVNSLERTRRSRRVDYTKFY